MMIIKYLSFLLGLIWSYSFIRTQSIFSTKTALLFKFFISKVSWITFILACYFGFKNFSIKSTLIGIQHQNENLTRNSFLGTISPVTGFLITENNAGYL